MKEPDLALVGCFTQTRCSVVTGHVEVCQCTDIEHGCSLSSPLPLTHPCPWYTHTHRQTDRQTLGHTHADAYHVEMCRMLCTDIEHGRSLSSLQRSTWQCLQ